MFQLLELKDEKYRPLVSRTCDKCGKVEIVRKDRIVAGRKRHPGVDHCLYCCYKGRNILRGVKHGNYNGGLTKNGYQLVRISQHGKKYKFKHQLVMEEKLGRVLLSLERVHHIDLDKSNNDPANLHLCRDEKEHQKCHASLMRVGFSLVGKLIWFDRENKTYTTDPVVYFPVGTAEPLRKTHFKTDPRSHLRYEFVSIDGQRKRFHVFLIEQLEGRSLSRNECVHHIDGNTLNNHLNNLVRLTNGEHHSCQFGLQQRVVDLYRRGIISFDAVSSEYHL